MILFILLILVLIIFGGFYLGEVLLKAKFNPNEYYLKEIKELRYSDKNKALNKIEGIIALSCGVLYVFNRSNSFYQICFLILILRPITELIRSKRALAYLKGKNNSDSTRKYLISNWSYCVIFTLILMVGLIYYTF